MSREETILKLLAACGSASSSELPLITGWGDEATRTVVEQLLAAGQIAFVPQQGNTAARGVLQGRALCLPATRQEILVRMTRARRREQRLGRMR